MRAPAPHRAFPEEFAVVLSLPCSACAVVIGKNKYARIPVGDSKITLQELIEDNGFSYSKGNGYSVLLH